MTEDAIVGSLWSRHRQWSVVADRLKSPVFLWRTVVLVLSAAGATLQTLSVSLAGSTVAKLIAVAGAIALVVVPLLARAFLGAEQVRKWLRARSMSEALKSEVYRFRARAAPYDQENRVAQLRESGRALETWMDALASEIASVVPDGKAEPGPLDAESYVTRRVTSQIETYYRPQARDNARRAARYRQLELATAVAAAILGAVVTTLHWSSPTDKGGIGAWVAVLTTIGGALAAHAAANRYDQQARMYFATARQLADLRDDWIAKGKPTDAPAWSAFVRACEDAISAENRGWMAKLDPEEKPA